MKLKAGKDSYFFLYMILVLIGAVVYFTMPERAAFLKYQVKWWGEMWDVVKEGIGVR